MKFSIITVVKNGISNIGLTIKSVKKQSFKDYEHLILDGNSIDGTSEYIKKRLNKKITYFRENDRGLYDAINKSFKKVKGEYLIILHSGDFFFSRDSLKNLSVFIDKNNKYDFYFSNILFYNKKKNSITRIWKVPEKKAYKLNFLKIAHTSLCIKRYVSKKLLYDDRLKISADTVYMHQLCKTFKGKYFDKFLIYMDDTGLSNSNDFFLLKFREDFKFLFKEFHFFSPFILIYKILIKIPGLIKNKKKYDKAYFNEIRKLIK